MSKIFAAEKVDQSSPKSPKICYAPLPLIVPNFIALGQTVYEKKKRYKAFYTLQYFGAPGGPAVPKFTSLGPDIQQA